MTPAEMAAQAWGGRILRTLRDRENHVFEMSTPQGRAALRLHRAGYQSPDSDPLRTVVVRRAFPRRAARPRRPARP